MSIRGQWFVNGIAWSANAGAWGFITQVPAMAIGCLVLAILSFYIAKKASP